MCKHSTNTYIHKILRLLIREGKKSNTREKKRRKKENKLKHYKTASQISKAYIRHNKMIIYRFKRGFFCEVCTEKGARSFVGINLKKYGTVITSV